MQTSPFQTVQIIPLTAQAELISKSHSHHIKMLSLILSRVMKVSLPGSEAVRMRASKMDFWKLSIGAFSPGPWGRKAPVVTASLRRSWRTGLVEKLRNELLLWVLWRGWLCVTCITSKGKRLNEGGFGSRAESFLKWHRGKTFFSRETSSYRPDIPQSLLAVTTLLFQHWQGQGSSSCIIKVTCEQLGKIILWAAALVRMRNIKSPNPRLSPQKGW